MKLHKSPGRCSKRTDATIHTNGENSHTRTFYFRNYKVRICRAFNLIFISCLTVVPSILSCFSFPGFARRKKMARNGVAFTAHFPANQTALQNTAHTARHFTFTYDDLYNCLYRHNEPQLIDIEAFKRQRKSSQSDGDRPKETISKLRILIVACKSIKFVTLLAWIDLASSAEVRSNLSRINLIVTSDAFI